MRWLGLLVIMILSGCESASSDLDAYFRDVKNKPSGSIEPLPEYPAYEPYNYSAMNFRSPFEKPQNVVAIEIDYTPDVRPIFDRVRQPLESYSADDLRLVGGLQQKSTVWALIQDPTGRVHRITIGDYIGQHHGRVTEVDDDFLAYIELVPAGENRWRERPRSIKLVSMEQ